MDRLKRHLEVLSDQANSSPRLPASHARVHAAFTGIVNFDHQLHPSIPSVIAHAAWTSIYKRFSFLLFFISPKSDQIVI
jgi:hypothetical protein